MINIKTTVSYLLLFGFVGCLIYIGYTNSSGITTTARQYEGEPVKLSFPFKGGTYHIMNGGSTKASNYHYWYPFFRQKGIHVSMRYAVDICKVGAVANPTSLSDYATYGEPLYSPCDGTVAELVDGLPDVPIGKGDTKNPRGNHIVIDTKGVKVTMLHLRKGSFTVKIGDAVKAGQLLAAIGNSGLTSEPHLHIQASSDSTWFGEGRPILFDDKFLVKGDKVVKP